LLTNLTAVFLLIGLALKEIEEKRKRVEGLERASENAYDNAEENAMTRIKGQQRCFRELAENVSYRQKCELVNATLVWFPRSRSKYDNSSALQLLRSRNREKQGKRGRLRRRGQKVF
jgi:hypothetical protein